MAYQHTPETKKTIAALWRVEKIILDSLDFNEVVQDICDSVLLELGYLELGYEIVVLCLKEDNDHRLKRVSISRTKKAKEALKKSPVPFHEIDIPLSYKSNLLIQSMQEQVPKVTRKWPDILEPAFTEQEASRIQQDLGIKASLIFPVISRGRGIGTLIFSMSKDPVDVNHDERDLLKSFADIVGLAVQNAKLYSMLEGVTKDLRKANRHLRQLDKLKDEFVFIATHELRNPVTAIKGYLSMLEEGTLGKIPPKLKDAIDQINISNQQLVNLVNDLLQIARSEAHTLKVEVQPIDLCPIVDEIIVSVKPLADQKKLTLNHSCPSKNGIKVQADPNRVKEVIGNLVGNAIKYSDKGAINITHALEGNLVVTHVADQGVGISDKAQKHIFTRFFRAEEEVIKGTPGTGLGLFIVKQLVEKMQGKIWFTSKLGQGSTFSFSLPKV